MLNDVFISDELSIDIKTAIAVHIVENDNQKTSDDQKFFDVFVVFPNHKLFVSHN